MILDKTDRCECDVEHNGLTLNGVGNGTTINNVFVKSASDAIEFFEFCKRYKSFGSKL